MASWLQHIDNDAPIGWISLPGTHDSAAINTWAPSTPYACHNTSLTDQLESGIRLLDIRLKIIQSGAHFKFVTCHGDIGANEYQSFGSAMQECSDFLRLNPSEFIAMSLKIDDWSTTTDKPAAYRALLVLLQEYPIYANDSNMPVLSQVRGKIYLLNRMNDNLALGVPITWGDNTTGEWARTNPKRNFRVYVQDHYKGLPTIGSEQEKLGNFTGALSNRQQPNEMLLNFASATFFGLFGVYIMGMILEYLGQQTSTERDTSLGWTLFDYETTSYQTNTYGFLNVVQMVIASNFSYRGYEKQFKVIGDGKDEL